MVNSPHPVFADEFFHFVLLCFAIGALLVCYHYYAGEWEAVGTGAERGGVQVCSLTIVSPWLPLQTGLCPLGLACSPLPPWRPSASTSVWVSPHPPPAPSNSWKLVAGSTTDPGPESHDLNTF